MRTNGLTDICQHWRKVKMAKSLAQVMKGLPDPRRKRIKQRSAVLIHE